MYKLLVNQILNYVDVFIPGNFYISFVSTSSVYIIIPKNKRKTKITGDKKLTTAYMYTLGPSLQQTYCPLIV